jgi:RpiR family transcriptional regulator, carbohydrate utilization regulator
MDRQVNGGRDSALMRRIAQARHQLSDGRRQLLEGILDRLDETVFLSSRELATRFRTDAATIVRTTQALGYGQFADFARDLRSHFLTHVNPYRIMAREVTVHRGAAFHVQACLERDLQNVRQAQQQLDPAALVAAGARLYRAARIVVVAGDLEHSLAEFLAYTLSALGLTASAPKGEGLTLHHQRALQRDDALVAISFRRCLRVPVEAVQAARKAGAYTLALTDASSTPLARFADAALLVPIEGESFASSYAGTMVAINALAVACAHADPKHTLKVLKPTDEEYVHGPRWYREPGTPRAAAGRARKARGPRAR